MQNLRKPDFFSAFFISIILHFLLLSFVFSFAYTQNKNLPNLTPIINLSLSYGSEKQQKIIAENTVSKAEENISASKSSAAKDVSVTKAEDKILETKPAEKSKNSDKKTESEKQDKKNSPTPQKRPKIKREMPQPSFGESKNIEEISQNSEQISNHNLRYELVFSSWLRRFQFYPEEAAGAVGSVQCAIRLNRQGQVKAVLILASSGNAALDKAMEQAVMMASPFPVVPEDFRPKESEIQLVTELFYAPE